jgi:hypothetical protein
MKFYFWSSVSYIAAIVYMFLLVRCKKYVRWLDALQADAYNRAWRAKLK